MNHADNLRRHADLKVPMGPIVRQDLRTAAAHIEQLEAEIAALKPHRSQTVAYAEGHGPEDPPMPATLREKVSDAIATILLQQPSDLLPVNERPYLERTELAQQEFNDRTRHGE